jgi:predicted nucleotidyltransferase
MNLNTVPEIERAIDALTPDQREELYVWLDEHYLQAGDRLERVVLFGARARGDAEPDSD